MCIHYLITFSSWRQLWQTGKLCAWRSLGHSHVSCPLSWHVPHLKFFLAKQDSSRWFESPQLPHSSVEVAIIGLLRIKSLREPVCTKMHSSGLTGPVFSILRSMSTKLINGSEVPCLVSPVWYFWWRYLSRRWKMLLKNATDFGTSNGDFVRAWIKLQNPKMMSFSSARSSFFSTQPYSCLGYLGASMMAVIGLCKICFLI